MSKRTRVVLAVFLDVEEDASGDLVDVGDASMIARRAIVQAMGDFDGRIHEVTVNKYLFNVRVHEAIEVGMASGNGYLWTSGTAKAFRQYEWQQD